MATVLAVDDEEDILTIIRHNLEREGHRVLTARNGDRALEIVREEKPDVVVLDVMMPGTDGWGVLNMIKAERDELAAIPVLMLTARAADEDRIRGGIEGAIRYLTKPFSPRDLCSEVAAALEGEPEPLKRRKVQKESLSQLARLEKKTSPAAGPPRKKTPPRQRPPALRRLAGRLPPRHPARARPNGRVRQLPDPLG